jgi:hypothetical protein
VIWRLDDATADVGGVLETGDMGSGGDTAKKKMEELLGFM